MLQVETPLGLQVSTPADNIARGYSPNWVEHDHRGLKQHRPASLHPVAHVPVLSGRIGEPLVEAAEHAENGPAVGYIAGEEVSNDAVVTDAVFV